jgi:hypothetical protein
MGKLIYYLGLMTGLTLLFHITGIMQTSNPLLSLLLSPQTMNVSLGTIIGAISISVGAIVIGFVTKDLDKAAMAVIVPSVLLWLWDFKEVYNKVEEQNGIFALLIFSPFFFIFIMSMIDWWRGREN